MIDTGHDWSVWRAITIGLKATFTMCLIKVAEHFAELIASASLADRPVNPTLAWLAESPNPRQAPATLRPSGGAGFPSAITAQHQPWAASLARLPGPGLSRAGFSDQHI
jgi:hypothetical protein